MGTILAARETQGLITSNASPWTRLSGRRPIEEKAPIALEKNQAIARSTSQAIALLSLVLVLTGLRIGSTTTRSSLSLGWFFTPFQLCQNPSVGGLGLVGEREASFSKYILACTGETCHVAKKALTIRLFFA